MLKSKHSYATKRVVAAEIWQLSMEQGYDATEVSCILRIFGDACQTIRFNASNLSSLADVIVEARVVRDRIFNPKLIKDTYKPDIDVSPVQAREWSDVEEDQK